MKRTYVLVEGHGEEDAVGNLLFRLGQESAPKILPFARPIRVPGISNEQSLLRYLELVRAKRDAHAVLAIRDNDDGCPKLDAPSLSARIAALNLPFPAASVMAYREYESIFLPCIEHMAGKSLDGPGGTRPGLRKDAKFEGDFESVRGVKEWLTRHMSPNRTYKPTVDQLPLTRMLDFSIVRAKGLPWFGTLERALQFLEHNLGSAGRVYPPSFPPVH